MHSNILPADPADVVILTIVDVELRAILATLGLSDQAREKLPNGTVVHRTTLASALPGRGPLRVVVACVASAGNPGAAALATQLAVTFRPKCMVLVGIAAGMRDKHRLGAVLIAERIVAYEPEALVARSDGTRERRRRPEVLDVPFAIRQDVVHYAIDTVMLERRLGDLGFALVESGVSDRMKRFEVSKGATIAAGEKLIRDAALLRTVREQIHDKVEAGDMESFGFAKACEQQDVRWVVIRGISDFGDPEKADNAQPLAATAASILVVDFLQRGLDLVGQAPVQGVAHAGQTNHVFQWGAPIDSDEGFLGREDEKRLLLERISSRQGVEILGGALVGKSSLLRWLARNAPRDMPIVRLERGAGGSPVLLVATIAERLQRADLAKPVYAKASKWQQAQQVLKELVPFTILVDDGDKLARADAGFDDSFLSCIRGHVEEGRMRWVSASDRPLHDIFGEKKLSSDFLNSSEKIWLGSLDARSAQAIANAAGAPLAALMLAEAGGFAYGLQWLGDHLTRPRENADAVMYRFRDEMARVFATWIAGLTVQEKRVLRTCADAPIPIDGASEDVLKVLYRIAYRKLVVCDARIFRLASGEAWKRFVRESG